VERTITVPTVKAKLADLVVGLAADCDNPESSVEQIMRAKLPGATGLPFVAFITHDNKWVDGYSGGKTTSAFIDILDGAEKSPYLQASKAVRKKLAGMVPRAEKAAKKGNWKTVVKAGQEAAKTSGRCPERTQIKALVKQARTWAAKQFATAIKLARTKGDTSSGYKLLNDVKKHFTGEPEAKDAATGLKALKKLAQIQKIEAKGTAPEGLRERSAKPYKDTRWAKVFTPGDESAADDEESSEIEIGED
jgi:hypothetical protein